MGCARLWAPLDLDGEKEIDREGGIALAGCAHFLPVLLFDQHWAAEAKSCLEGGREGDTAGAEPGRQCIEQLGFFGAFHAPEYSCPIHTVNVTATGLWFGTPYTEMV